MQISIAKAEPLIGIDTAWVIVGASAPKINARVLSQ
jgi:hypothetical protein